MSVDTRIPFGGMRFESLGFSLDDGVRGRSVIRMDGVVAGLLSLSKGSCYIPELTRELI